MPNVQIRSALILPADWKLEFPRRAPGETEPVEFEAADELEVAPEPAKNAGEESPP